MSAARARRLRVVTFNIHHGADAHDRLDLGAVIEVLRSADADVLALQEVDRFWARSDLADQPTLIAEALGMHVAFAPALTLAPEPGSSAPREYGHALLSRAPLHEVARIPLPTDGPSSITEPRLVLRARIEIDGTSVAVGATHLDPLDSGLRERQARALLAALPEQGPMILAGDLNSSPEDPALHLLRTRLDDVWTQDAPGITFVGDGQDPHAARIDYVLARGLDHHGAEVLESARGVSDHLPLLAKLGVPELSPCERPVAPDTRRA
ncbi:endonuclease/exonuclease/phosphatase family protein [Brachybacterium hainanense]|uniref:Endonuclease/exonuclease/phosphatase family protein n=1 Tax=Brachybacterium hainanense TaxID=1541174 RepID=A0ABV6RD34_9MICO